MKKYISVFTLVLFLASAIAGCTPDGQKNTAGSNKADDKIKIVATIFPQYDFARAVVGDKADLTMLLNPGAEMHSYDPSPADIIKIQKADVFIYTGGESDVWVKSILDSMDTSHKKIIRLMDWVTPVEEEVVEGMEAEEHEHDKEPGNHEEEEAEYDEHVWTSPQNAVLMIKAIADALCEIDPPNAGAYQKNAAAYTAQIAKVDGEIKEIVDKSANKLVVFGDRFPFRYFAEEFGLEYRAAFNGCSTETEASAGTIAYLIKTVKDNKIPYIYYIEFSNQNIARSISEQTGAGMLLLHSCHNVTKDDFAAGVTYLSLMKQNAENLRKGLR